ncbi:MAG TPA: hypothetical protein VGN51_08295 [Acidimicrobiia bacterium]
MTRTSRRGLALVEKMVGTADALDCYRSLSWTVTGFVILEQTLEESVHHRRVGPTRWELDLDDRSEPSAFDTDELFRTTLGLALDGLERRTTR